jgi:serine/threonine protein phosphatase PrpC
VDQRSPEGGRSWAELLCSVAMDSTATFKPAVGAVVAFSAPRPRSASPASDAPATSPAHGAHPTSIRLPPAHPNQDAALVLELQDGALVLAVADGMGGARGGARAAKLAVEKLREAIGEGGASTSSLRERILDGFDRANAAVRRMRLGAGATLVVAAIVEGAVRLFHAGDAQALVVGQRGAVKALTRSHSPVGFAVAAGVLDYDEALHHPALHLVANGLGNPELTVEVSSPLPLGARDTLLLASDGLFDNLYLYEVVELIRRGALPKVGRSLVELIAERMAAAFQPAPLESPFAIGEADYSGPADAGESPSAREESVESVADSAPEPPDSLEPPAPEAVIEEAEEPLTLPSKPDDLTFLLYRRGSRAKRGG